MAKKKISPLATTLLETAADMRKAGLMDKATHEKITRRLLGMGGRARRYAPAESRHN